MNRVISLIFALGTVLLLAAEAITTTGYYWIDANPPVEFAEPPTAIPVAELHDGMHTFNIVARTSDGRFSIPYSSPFMKISSFGESGPGCAAFVDGVQLPQTDFRFLGNGNYICEMDMANISAGVHNLQMVVFAQSGGVSDVFDAWFFRIPSDKELETTSVAYFIDGVLSGIQPLTHNGVAYLADIDTEALQTGIHSIEISFVLADGSMTPYEGSWFYKTPVPAGIVSYEYWFDDATDNIHKTELEESTDDFSLITMIDVPQLPFDSRSYAFSIKNGVPTICGKHDIRMRFFESDGRPNFQTSDFIESRYPLTISPNLLQSGRTEVPVRKENEIKWYKFNGEIGDSVVLNLTRPAMCELYSPTGVELLRKKGTQTEAQNSLTLRENGEYYFAAHDAVNDRTAPFGINFQHIPRNAILSVTPSSSIAENKFALFDLFGNGMKDAEKFILQSDKGVVFATDSVFAYDNYHLSAVIMPEDSIPSGVYDVALMITDALSGEEKMIVKKDALSVVSSSGKSDINVRVVPTRKASTPYMVDIIVSNDSDSPCWGIPFNIACERNHGKNGFVFYMSDFLGESISANTIPWYESDNMLGTGTDGIFFPVTLSYMHPHEQRRLRVGIISDPHEHVGLYAWAGTPYSEESRNLMAIPADSLNAMPVLFTNIFDLKTAAYVASVLDETTDNESDRKEVRRANSDNNHVLEIAREYGPDAIGKYKPLERPSGYADNVAKLAENYGKTEAGIVNSGAGYHAYMYFKHEEHIPGNTLGEQIKNIEAMYPGAPESIPPGALQIYYLQAKKTLGRGHSPQEIAEDSFAPDWYQLAKQFICRNADSGNPMPTRNDIDVFMSGDPNSMTGYVDPSGGNAVGLHVDNLNYVIEFENDPALASVPASTIIVNNNLDGNVFDLKSFKPKELKIGSLIVDLPSEHQFVKTIDLRPERECIAEIRLDYSEKTGESEWTLRSLDPLTLLPVFDARQGLLPVNNANGDGIGLISYDIDLRNNLVHSQTISNKASIIFDSNDAIETPEWINVTDYELPVSSIVGEQPYEDNAYRLSVNLKDEGSGVMSYDLYVKTEDDDTWRVVKSGLTENQILFETEDPINGIRFMTLATDCAGNRQIKSDSDINTGIIESQIDDNPETWYDINGIKASGDHKESRGIQISTKGRKVIVR